LLLIHWQKKEVDGHAGDYKEYFGPAEKQASYSTYRLHLGHFDSFWIKRFYFLMGLMLSLVTINPDVIFYLSLILLLVFNIRYGERFNGLKTMHYLLISLIPTLLVMYVGIKLL
jgi:hypothetical protein